VGSANFASKLHEGSQVAMTSESLFGEICARTARIFAATLETEPVGAILSIDIGGSFLDRLAWSAANAFGCEFEAFPSLMRHRSNLWDYRYPLKPVDVAQEPIMFGSCDGWLQSFDEGGAWRNYSLELGNVAVRSIDSWSEHRPPLRLLHLGDAALVADQLRGAEATLRRDHPLVTLYPPQENAVATATLSFLEEIGYRILDLQDQPAVPTGNARKSGSWGWIAIPPAEWEARSTEQFTDTCNVAQSLWAIEQMENAGVPLRQRRSAEIFGLGRIAPPQLALTIPISETICVNDCYPVEADGMHSWRWLGPQSRSRLAVPCAFPGTYRFEVAVISCRTPGGISAWRVLVDGREVPITAQGTDRGTLSFVGQIDASGYAGYGEIDFVNREAPPPAGSDSRTLRINLGAIGIAPCH
jgi:hypothetical protein